jgi:hypothetical protein
MAAAKALTARAYLRSMTSSNDRLQQRTRMSPIAMCRYISADIIEGVSQNTLQLGNLKCVHRYISDRVYQNVKSMLTAMNC